jgi:hypothetical protein
MFLTLNYPDKEYFKPKYTMYTVRLQQVQMLPVIFVLVLASDEVLNIVTGSLSKRHHIAERGRDEKLCLYQFVVIFNT